MSNSLLPQGPQPTRLPFPWDLPGKNTGVGSHACLPGNLLHPGIQLVSPELQNSLPLSHQGSLMQQYSPNYTICLNSVLLSFLRNKHPLYTDINACTHTHIQTTKLTCLPVLYLMPIKTTTLLFNALQPSTLTLFVVYRVHVQSYIYLHLYSHIFSKMEPLYVNLMLVFLYNLRSISPKIKKNCPCLYLAHTHELWDIPLTLSLDISDKKSSNW